MFRQLFFLLFFISSSFSSQILFCLHSKAEAIDLEGLIECYLAEDHEISILAFGTAKMHLDSRYNLIPLPEKLANLGQEGPYSTKLEQVDELIAILPANTTVITGLASHLQIELINRLSCKKVVAVVDGFYTFETHPCTTKLDKNKIDMLLVPWHGMIPYRKDHFSCPIKAVGKADLEQRFSRNPDPTKLMILYSGGYGPNYAKDFQLFVKLMQHWQRYEMRDHEIVISLHPAHHVDGSIEKEAIANSSLKNVTIAPKDSPTSLLMEKAHILVSAYSTTTIKAILNQLPAIHVSSTFSNSLTKQKVIPVCSTRRVFLTSLNQLLDAKPHCTLQLEPNSTKKMSEVIAPFLIDDQCSPE